MLQRKKRQDKLARIAQGTESAGVRSRVISGLVGNFAVAGLSIAQQVLMVPLFLSSWSMEQYASWLVLFSFSVILAAADMGLHTLSINRYQWSLSLPIKQSTIMLSREVRTFFNSYILNTVSLMVLLTVFFIFGDVVSFLDLQGAEKATLYWAFFYTAGSGLALSLMGGCTAFYRSHLKVARIMAIRVSMQLLLIALQAVILIEKQSILLMSFAHFAVNSIALLYMCFIDIPRFSQVSMGRWWRFSFSGYRRTLMAAAPFIIPSVSEPILSQAPVFLLGLVGPGPIAVITYSLCRTITSVPKMLVQQLCGVIGPELGAHAAKKDEEGVRTNLRFALSVSAVTIGGIVGLMVGMIEPVYRTWTQGKVAFDAMTFWPICATLVITGHVFVGVIALVYSSRADLATRLQVGRILALCAFSTILGWLAGAPGAAAALLLTEVLFASLPYFFALQREFGMRAKEIIESSVITTLKWFLAFSILSLGVAYWIDLGSVAGLSIAIVICGAAWATALFIVSRRVLKELT